MMLPSAVVWTIANDNNRDAIGDSNSRFNERATQMLVALSVHKHSVGIANVLLVLKPKFNGMIRSIRCSKR